jgi:hypothetical protein
MQSLLDGPLAGASWVVTHCRTLDEARVALMQAKERFDYILAEPGVESDAEHTLGRTWQAAGRPPLIRFAADEDRAGGWNGGGYGLYPQLGGGAGDSPGEEEDQWILEFHRPCQEGGSG